MSADQKTAEEKVQESFVYCSDDTEDEDEDEEVEDMAELEKPKIVSKGRRNTVMAAKMEVDADWTAPVYEKTDEVKDKLKSLCSKIFMFANLSPAELETTLMAFKAVAYEKGQVVIEQGKMPADYFYIRESGDVRVIKNGEDLGIFKEQSFGELALLYDAPRAATIECASDCDLWALDRITFKKVIVQSVRTQRVGHLKILKGVSILQTLNESELERLTDAINIKNVSKGEVVIREKDEGGTMYIIESGEFKCTQYDDETGEDVEVAVLDDGKYFGEIALLKNEKRKATVTCTTDAVLLEIERKVFKRLLGGVEDLLKRNADLYDEITRQAMDKAHKK